MEGYKKWEKELGKYQSGKSKYKWDEIEELITDEFEDGRITSDEFDTLMTNLMKLDCD